MLNDDVACDIVDMGDLASIVLFYLYFSAFLLMDH